MIHSQCPTKVAAAVAKAPYHRLATPCSLILFLTSLRPATPPCVCCVVLIVSIGVRVILNVAEATLAAIVLTRTGQVNEERSARIPALAAVSPNRDRGPWKLDTGQRLQGARRHRTKDLQSRCQTGIVSLEPTVVPQSQSRGLDTPSVPILIVHDRPHGHQRENLNDHSGCTCQTTTTGRFERGEEVEIHIVGDTAPSDGDCECDRESSEECNIERGEEDR